MKRIRMIGAAGDDDDASFEGTVIGGALNAEDQYKELEHFFHQYSNFQQNKLYYSPSGRRLYLRIFCYGQTLTWQFFYKNLLALYYTDPRIKRVAIQLSFIIYNLKTLEARYWFPSSNSSVMGDHGYVNIKYDDVSDSLKKIRRILKNSERQDFLNKFTLAYSEQSLSSVAIPFYVLYTGVIEE